jgi:hypothetical protein
VQLQHSSPAYTRWAWEDYMGILLYEYIKTIFFGYMIYEYMSYMNAC